MRTRTALSVTSGFILAISLLLVPKARATEWDQATRLTFSQPIQIPGNEILAAGTYWFVTVPDVSRDMVQIFNADRSKLYATIQTIPVERSETASATEINLAEPRGNEPKELLSWFYPGRMTGHEFLYNGQEEKAIRSEPVLKVTARAATPAYGD
jgi:hypothetical protein